jgi:hypothetical protein
MHAGHLQTLISVDARQVSNFFVSCHALVSLPLQIAAALVVLWWKVQAAFVAGLLLVIALMPVNRLLTWLITRASRRMMEHKDWRLDVMSNLLENLRSIFMLGWQAPIQQEVVLCTCSTAPACNPARNRRTCTLVPKLYPVDCAAHVTDASVPVRSTSPLRVCAFRNALSGANVAACAFAAGKHAP